MSNKEKKKERKKEKKKKKARETYRIFWKLQGFWLRYKIQTEQSIEGNRRRIEKGQY